MTWKASLAWAASITSVAKSSIYVELGAVKTPGSVGRSPWTHPREAVPGAPARGREAERGTHNVYFLYAYVLGRPRVVEHLPRRKRARRLPTPPVQSHFPDRWEHHGDPTTATGVGTARVGGQQTPGPPSRAAIVVRSPSSPALSSPQQYAAWAAVSAHMWYVPAAMAMAGAKPTTGTAVSRSLSVPSPTSPDSFNPQHATAPVVSRTQVCASPITSSVTATV